MTILNLGPLGIAAVTPVGEDAPLTIRRWMLVAFAPVIVAAWGYSYALDGRVSKLEAAPTSNVAYEQRVQRLERIVDGYETLKLQREREIATLNAQLSAMRDSMIQINGKLDRLLFGQQRERR